MFLSQKRGLKTPWLAAGILFGLANLSLAGSNLSHELALSRSAVVSDVRYKLGLTLRAKKPDYTGTNAIYFRLKKVPKKLHLDFQGEEIRSLKVNGKSVAGAKIEEGKVWLPVAHLKAGKNHVELAFRNDYDTDGSGLHKIKDSADGKEYVYTDFEPYDANRMFPSFDQPDLKASYRLTVKAPPTWKVVGNGREYATVGDGDLVRHEFTRTEKFSTYIAAMCAGPFAVWTDTRARIPSRIFAVQSMAEHVDSNRIFKITRQGFDFFEEYFDIKYPFHKYDQIFLPQFNSGAMENVGAVTFNGNYIYRHKATRAELQGRSNTILHEMAHMWFGDIVTMEWWNDLWLNESFATYMANLALVEATEYTESWRLFTKGTKTWAYWQDQLPTTHPIETLVPDTDTTFTNFDGITYGKGASSLKQLVFLIGEENFKLGLAEYFKTYATKNTKREDFIKTLQNHTSENLKTWTNQWLQTKGLNTITTKFTCIDNKLKDISFLQGYTSGDKILRTHKVEFAMWLEDSSLKPEEVFTLRISGEETNWTPLKEVACPKAVFPNWNDHGYIKVSLDEASSGFLLKNIHRFESNLFKSQLWTILNSKLKFGEIAPEDVIALLKTEIPKENNSDVLNSILKLLYPDHPIFELYTDKKRAVKERKSFAKTLKSRILETTDTDLKKILFRKWVYSSYEDNPFSIYKCLTKCSFDQGFVIDLDTKWFIANKLSAVRFKKNSYVKELSKKDPSRRGVLNKLASKVSYAKNKEPWLSKALDETSGLSLKERITILKNIVPFTQREKYFTFKQNSFFEKIDQISLLPLRVQRAFAENFAPLFCGEFSNNIPITEEQVNGAPWNYGVQKQLLKKLDIEKRCLKIKGASNLIKKKGSN
ncbi:MAG: aminopeptidase N [Bdellovibrionales bacterium]